MKVRNILVHSCRVKRDGCPRYAVISGDLYVGELGKGLEEQSWYHPLPKSCRCKRYIGVDEATEYVGRGWAVWILQFKRKKGEVILNEEVSTKVWMPVVRERVPRVDLISRADIERSVIGSEQKSRHYKFNPVSKRFEIIKEVPEGMTEKEWIKDATDEINFERRIRKQYTRYINECYKVAMDARAELIVPFRPDPFEGRTLFPFNVDQRTQGGHLQ